MPLTPMRHCQLRLPAVLAAAVLVLLPAAAWANASQEPEGPKDFLQKAARAVQALQGASYRSEYAIQVSVDLGMPIPSGSTEVRFQRLGSDDPVGARILAQGRLTLSGPEPISLITGLAYDGATLRALDPDKKVLLEGDPAKDGMDLMGYAPDQMLSLVFLADEPFARELGFEDAELQPDTAIGGVACRVVRVKPDEPEVTYIDWYLGAQDFLPRRFVVHFDVAGQPGQPAFTGTQSLSVLDLVANPDFQDGAFRLAAPEGWETQAYERTGQGPELLAVGSEAPDWSLQDPEGVTHTLADYRGQVVVLDFWATWCTPCVRAMPGVQKLHERFADQKVKVFGVHVWDEDADPVGFMKDKGLTYGLLLQGDEVAAAYQVSGIPTFYVIGTDGRILVAEVGFDPSGEERLAKKIEEHLAQDAR